MIDRYLNTIRIICDECGETYEGDRDEEFHDVWAGAKSDGWYARKIDDEWVHGCPDCGAPE